MSDEVKTMNIKQLKERMLDSNYCSPNDDHYLLIDVGLEHSQLVSAVNAIEAMERQLAMAVETLEYIAAERTRDWLFMAEQARLALIEIKSIVEVGNE